MISLLSLTMGLLVDFFNKYVNNTDPIFKKVTLRNLEKPLKDSNLSEELKRIC